MALRSGRRAAAPLSPPDAPRAILVVAGEGAPLERIRAARRAGAEAVVLAGTCRLLATAHPGPDLALVADHLNLTGSNPLVGANDEAVGPRFPDMTEVYDRDLRVAARSVAEATGQVLAEGVLAQVSPGRTSSSSSASSSDARLLALGADFVADDAEGGVVSAALVARHAGLRVVALLGIGEPPPRAVLDALLASVGGRG